MTFDPTKPQSTDFISDSQPVLLSNNQQLNTVFDVDHLTYNASANRGKHKKVTLRSQGSDSSTDSPPTRENEYAMFTLQDGSDTEIYLRGEQNATAFQATRNNELFMRVYPVFAINMDNSDASNPIPSGSASVFSSYNLNNINRLSGSSASFQFNFTNPVLDSSGVATNNYLWTANCFHQSSSNPSIAQVPPSGTYSTVVGNNFIRIQCINQNGTLLTNIRRLVVICWKFQ